MLTKNQFILKHTFDFCIAFIGLVVLIIPIIILIILMSISTKSFGLFKQKRVGQFGELFDIYKIKTMINDSLDENTITITNNKRITNFGKKIRKYKLDELPQLINVLIGNMSFVGPRPDVIGYADELKGEDKIILNVRPGITGPATLYFKNEEEILSKKNNPKEYNDTVIWKKKIEINKNYIKDWSFFKDLSYLFKTIV